MRIALLAPGFSRSADHWAIPVLQNLATRLAQKHDIEVFSLRYPERGTYCFHGLVHHAIGGGQRRGLASVTIWAQTVRAIWQAHRQRPFDCLHAFWIDEPGLTAVLAGHLIRRPTIATIGGGELVYLPDIAYGTAGSAVRRSIVQITLCQADVISAGSQYQLQMAQAGSRQVLSPLGLDTALFTPGPLADWRRPTLIQVASLTGVKGQHMLLEILAAVKKTMPHVQLMLVGDGPLASDLRHRAQALAVAENITWLGAVPYPQMPPLYQKAHLYLQTSRHESQGMAVLEALACGLPALGTPVGVMPQVACLPPNWDTAALARQTVAVITERNNYAERREQARATAVRQYDLALTVERFQAIYESL